MLLGLATGLGSRTKSDPNLTDEQLKAYNRNKMLMNVLGGPVGGMIANPIMYQKALGKSQSERGFEAEKNLVRPEYQRPGEVTQGLNIQKQMAQTGIPQASKDYQQDMIDRDIAYSLQQSESRKGGLGLVGTLNQSANDAANKLAMQDAEQRIANQNAYTQGLYNAAQYSDKEFDYNKNQPYQMGLNRAMALQGAGIQNIFGAKQTTGKYGEQIAQTGLGLLGNYLTGGMSGMSGLGGGAPMQGVPSNQMQWNQFTAK